MRRRLLEAAALQQQRSQPGRRAAWALGFAWHDGQLTLILILLLFLLTCSNPVFKLRLSPVKRGRDSQGYDAILGKPGMHKLGIGMDREGRLFTCAPDDQIISAT